MKTACRLLFIVSVVMLIFFSALDVAIPQDEFLKKNSHPTYRKMAEINGGVMIVCFFALVGWIREARVEKMMKAAATGRTLA